MWTYICGALLAVFTLVAITIDVRRSFNKRKHRLDLQHPSRPKGPFEV